MLLIYSTFSCWTRQFTRFIKLNNGKTVARKHSLQKATHAIFRFEVDLAKHITLNVEGYYKWFNQLSNINRNKLYEETDDVKKY